VTNLLKAISIWQPWASLWLSPNKLDETRHWATSHRGPLLVHAAKKFIKDIDGRLGDILDSEFGGHWGRDLPTGAIVGMVNLVKILPTETLYRDRSKLTEDDEINIKCGDFSDGRYAWRRGVYRRFPQPIPYRGRQSMFSVPYDVVAAQIAASTEVAA